MKKEVRQQASVYHAVPSHRRKKLFSVVIEKDRYGYYAFCPQLQGCYTQGETYEETMGNIKDAIRLHIDDRIENGEEISIPEEVNLVNVEV